MTIYTMPSTPGFVRSTFGLVANTQIFSSPLSGAMQTLEMPGARWMATYTLPPMKRAQAADWIAFLVKLRGQANRFYAYDPDAKTARGIATGTPLVNGGSQTGNTLVTDGWTISQTGILKAGDYISFTAGGHTVLHMVVADANSDGSGNATFTIEPVLRASPADNAVITVASATCEMVLSSPDVKWDGDHVSRFGILFEGVEALT